MSNSKSDCENAWLIAYLFVFIVILCFLLTVTCVYNRILDYVIQHKKIARHEAETIALLGGDEKTVFHRGGTLSVFRTLVCRKFCLDLNNNDRNTLVNRRKQSIALQRLYADRNDRHYKEDFLPIQSMLESSSSTCTKNV
uniref:Uncharacterized protein n=1 Tax=Clytia hemisphaerica TaxID=252671 RepID=A0A7M5V704_9CNID